MSATCCGTSGKKVSPCCGQSPAYVSGYIETPAGKVPQVSGVWSKQESIGQIRCRISGSFRMHYTVDPGLYGIGNPTKESPVFVSANYKMSFDILRRELNGIDGWILVLDTRGINVWCAAGKGTFGTEEIINRIRSVGLEQYVGHRRIILPQLGAPGVQSHTIKNETGFSVKFGPVYAHDIKQYLNNGYKAYKQMRTVRFSLMDRMVLTPMEITALLKYTLIYALAVFALFGLTPQGILFKNALSEGTLFVIMGLLALFFGAYFTPVFLPFIPFRSFALKGFIVGVAYCALVSVTLDNPLLHNRYIQIAMFTLFPTITSYLALNFTGCTTFTNMSGVVKEMKIAILLYVIALAISIIALVIYKLVSWGIV